MKPAKVRKNTAKRRKAESLRKGEAKCKLQFLFALQTIFLKRYN